MQTRAIAGVDFENTLITEQWHKSEVKPKMIWNVSGNNVFEKIKNVGYDVTKFNLSKDSIVSKSDFVFHSDDTIRFEVKKYPKQKLKKWTMYSEPFFKVSDEVNASKVNVDEYNKFVDDFMEKRGDIVDYVLNSIGEGIIGIRCLDGFIHQDKLEYKAEVLKGWRGYKRITIMFRIKEGE